MKLQLISSPGCHICVEVKKIIEKIKPEFPDLEVEEIDMTMPKGQEMISKYAIMVSPGVVIENELFSVGGVNKDKLVEKLKSISESNRVVV